VIHLVFKTHLDVGFTDLAARVVDRYFTDYFPRAFAVARTLREREDPRRFVWTTGSWIVHEFLERADPANRKAMEQAIVAGDIAWHALPFTLHSELMDAKLFEFGLSLSQELDRRFGRTTIAGKMTDVPGHTLGIVPLLAAANVRFLHIGVNAASTVPDVPPVFRWRAPDGSEVIVMYQGGGYGAFRSVGGVSLAFAHTHDNIGPQTVEQVEAAFSEYDGAQGSTLDAFARDLLTANPDLPVIEDEIADSWIHGAGTDPIKVARFRELLRLPTENRRFRGRLLMVPEHTWGMDEKEYLDDDARYEGEAFATLRSEEKTKLFESSWAEQRAYLDEAVASLDDAERKQANERLAALVPRRRSGPPTDPVLQTDHGLVRFDERGAIVELGTWANPQRPLALFRYELFTATDYERFRSQYMVAEPHDLWWAIKDFTKPGIPAGEKRVFYPRLHQAQRVDDGVLLELRMPEEATHYGAPASLTLEVTRALELTLQWFDKKACRLPEACWLSFQPAIDADWRMRKLGTWLSPRRVIRRGNRTLHAVDRVECGPFALETLDAPLVAPGKPSLLDFHDRLPERGEGVHVNLSNNVWGTNFPMWCEDDARFRFRIYGV
jgi:hypothetical protein